MMQAPGSGGCLAGYETGSRTTEFWKWACHSEERIRQRQTLHAAHVKRGLMPEDAHRATKSLQRCRWDRELSRATSLPGLDGGNGVRRVPLVRDHGILIPSLHDEVLPHVSK